MLPQLLNLLASDSAALHTSVMRVLLSLALSRHGATNLLGVLSNPMMVGSSTMTPLKLDVSAPSNPLRRWLEQTVSRVAEGPETVSLALEPLTLSVLLLRLLCALGVEPTPQIAQSSSTS